MKIIQKTLPPPRPLRLCGQLFPYHIPSMSAPLSRQNLPENPSPDEILNVFLDYLTATGTEPYDHQEEAILELFAGNNVILNTPTGSGKSLIALRDGAHTPVDDVIMDEFHYYSDHSRGAAWQIPLLTLPRARAATRTLSESGVLPPQVESDVGFSGQHFSLKSLSNPATFTASD